MRDKNGFSLIELMVVITIISILSAIAIPSYQFYIKRARFTEVISTTEIYKTAVALAFEAGAPINEITTGLHGIPPPPDATKNLQSLSIENGIITATSSALLNGLTYILTPSNNGEIWTQSGTCLQAGLCETE
jgi:type IV pilus assembly protein PilA